MEDKNMDQCRSVACICAAKWAQCTPQTVCGRLCALSAKSRVINFCAVLSTNVTLFLTRTVQFVW